MVDPILANHRMGRLELREQSYKPSGGIVAATDSGFHHHVDEARFKYPSCTQLDRWSRDRMLQVFP